jgi:hypothetical protein
MILHAKFFLVNCELRNYINFLIFPFMIILEATIFSTKFENYNKLDNKSILIKQK